MVNAIAADELDEALAAFATRPSGVLARAIDDLGRAAIAGFEPPQLRKNVEFHRAWQLLAADSHARTWCLDTLLDKLPKLLDGKEHISGEKCDALVERLEVLRTLAPDPRIGRAMLALLELRAPVAGFTIVSDEVARVLVRHADDETHASPMLDELDQLDRTKLPSPAPVEAGDRARRARAKPIAPHDTAPLFAAVYAAPDDDEPRGILADALQETGDPRGELIALQLREHRGAGDTKLRERAQALVATHGKAWLAALRPITYRAELRRGFLHRLELAGSWSTTKWDELARDPSLATVEELVAGQATGKIVARMLRGTLAGAVRSLEVDDDELWKVIAAVPLPRLRELRAFRWKRRPYEQRFIETVSPYIDEHRGITRIGCELPMVTHFGDAFARRLTHLTVRGDVAGWERLWTRWPDLVSLRCEWSEPVELVRDGDRELARVYPRNFGWQPDLEALPRSIARVEVIGNKTVAGKLAAAYGKRFEVVAVDPPSGTITGVK